MKRASVAAVLALAAAAALAEPAPGLPEAPGRAETLAACGQCHAIDGVMSRSLTRRQWEVQVETMILKGAAVRDEDFDRIVEYLSTHAGRAATAPAQAPGGGGETPAPG